MLLQILITSWTSLYCIQGIQIEECTESSFQAVENTLPSLTCTGYSGTVTWDYKSPDANSRGIGTCGSTCQDATDAPPNFFTLTSLSASSSRLTLPTAVTTKRYIDTIFKCGSAECGLGIVVNAELGNLTLNLNNAGGGWTVSGTVPITRVFSSSRRYRCVWFRKHVNGQYTEVANKTLFPGANPNHQDKSGTCDFTDSLPDTTGTYTYMVQVYPGATEKTDSSVVIASPPAPSISCTPITGYVSEDTYVNCTCSGSVGRPEGRLVWVRRKNNVDTTIKEGSYGQESLQLRMTVNRSHDGNTLRCDVDWVTDTTGPAYNVNVAYGPDNASIPESPVFYTDSTGSHNLTLTCKPGDVNPTTGLTYTWTGRCAGVTSDRCTFKPRPPAERSAGEVGATVQCNVTNPVNNKMAQTSFVLQLKYPPSVAPKIQGYVDNTILYQGDPLKINCTVTGGEPHVTAVTLNCTSQSQQPHNGQSSSLNVTSLSAGYHGAVCKCSAKWIISEYYTLTATRTLTVYSPPSEPGLRRTDEKNKPYLEGDNVTLTCSVKSSGHPPANLTWSGHGNAVITNPDRKTSTFRLLSLSKEDHLRNITCHADNDFTRHKQRDFSDVDTIEVYYGPSITLENSSGNTCTMVFNPMTCTTVEGQRVHFRSHADSRPPLDLYVWQTPDGFDLDTAIEGELDIVSINRSQSGVYRVQVNTTKPDPTDSRLPLTSHHNLTVLVKYTVSDITFGMDSNKDLTINESQLVTFGCQSHGRPTPELELTRGNTMLHKVEGGKLSLSEVNTRLSHAITAQCNNTGLYTCSAHNGVGDTQRDTAQLYVNCKPRCNSRCSSEPLEIYYNANKAVAVEFRLVAFPVPEDNRFTFHVNGSDQNIFDNIKLNVTCDKTDTDYDVVCTLLVSDVTNKEAEGLYTFSAANAFGQEDFMFKVIVNGTRGPGGGLNIAVIAGTTCGAVVVLGVAAVVLFKARQRKKGAKKPQPNLTGSGSHSVSEREDPDMTVNEIYGTRPGGAAQDAEDEVMIVNAAYVSSANLGYRTSRNAYEVVELNSSTHSAGKSFSVPGSSREQASASAKKDLRTVEAPSSDDGSNMYATVNKGTKPSLGAQDGPGPAIGDKQRPGVKPKPAKKSKPGKLKDKPIGTKIAKQDDKQPLQTGEYGNVGMASLTMSPHSQEGSVYENYAFEKEESRKAFSVYCRRQTGREGANPSFTAWRRLHHAAA